MRHPGIAAVCVLAAAILLLLTHGTRAAPGGIWGARILVAEPKSGVVQRGHAATLECQFELQEGYQLYMVQWYRGSRGFYRHLSKSDAHRVRINGSGFALAGNYSCEITADAPTYSTATCWHLLAQQFGMVPPRPPALVIERGDYEPNDVLRANCTAGPARPAPTLTFYINDVPDNKIMETTTFQLFELNAEESVFESRTAAPLIQLYFGTIVYETQLSVTPSFVSLKLSPRDLVPIVTAYNKIICEHLFVECHN
ncbi:hypothetical protein B566_EDAN016820 [Ephemera danica]|nr:hypothetical protein B566_EDAN016820 [Ephemera danica]